jgi:para-nitrobenzyl esterase
MRAAARGLARAAALAGAIAMLPACAAVAGAAAPDSSAPAVKTRAGAVRGIARGAVREFIGVPYAAPPVGNLRWEPPQPHASWTGALDASQARSVCPQQGFRKRGIVGAEDCLYLNIYTPNPARARLPVMVWIHGGTFIAGAGSWYRAGNLAARGKPVVVTINYRLGPFGFLANRNLDSTDPRHVSGNYGLLDQQAALRWVKDNIAAFGGDPNSVTVAGESAGGISIGLHLVSPAAAGLFERAILESGPFLGPFHRTRTMAEAEARGDKFAARLGCDKAADVAGCLRSKTVAQVMAAIPANLIDAGDLVWAPAVDRRLIPAQPAALIAAGHFNKVPVINGSNRDEGSLFLAFRKPLSAQRYEADVRKRAGKDAAQVLAAYPLSNYASPTQAAAAAFGDLTFSCRILKAGELLAPEVPVFQYEFDDPRAPTDPYARPLFPLGAYHGSEIQYVFGTLAADPPPAPAQRRLSDAMMGYWIGFIASGRPGGSPEWKPLGAGQEKVFLLSPGTIGYESDFAKLHHCDFWNSLAR